MALQSLALTISLVLPLFTRSVETAPVVALPINAQVPPVARVSKPFDFTFASTTFSSTESQIRYSLSRAPAWLRFDSYSRAFSGTPTAADVGVVVFDVVAVDKQGSTSTSVTFIVSAEPGPTLGTPIQDQLPRFEALSGAEALLLYPSAPISVAFGSSTFDNINDSTVYYAVCTNNTPLPSWLHFDPNGLSFTGSSPAFNSPSELPQDIGIHLIASDVVGFSGAIASFHIFISSHELRFSSTTFDIDAEVGNTVEYVGLQNALRLDGNPVDVKELASIEAMTPNWLHFDPIEMTISGKVPRDATPQSFTINATDIYNDFANANVNVKVTDSSPSLIGGNIGTLHARQGSQFSYVFPGDLIPAKGAKVSVDLGDLSSWLSFDPAMLTLSGFVPRDLEQQSQELTLTVALDGKTQSQTFVLNMDNIGNTPDSTDVNTTTATQATVIPISTLPTQRHSQDETEQSKPWVAAAVLVPVAVLALAVCVLLCFRHRRNRQARDEEDIAAVKRLISRPQPQPDHVDTVVKATNQGEKVSPCSGKPPPVIPTVRNRRSDAPSGNSMMESFTQHFGIECPRPDSQVLPGFTQLSSQADTFKRIEGRPENPPAVKRSRSSLRRARSSGIMTRGTYGNGHGRALSTINLRALQELQDSVSNALESIQPKSERHDGEEGAWSMISQSPSLATIEQMVETGSLARLEDSPFPLPPLSTPRRLAKRSTAPGLQLKQTVRQVDSLERSPADRINPRLSSFRRKRATPLMSPPDSCIHSLRSYDTSRLASLFEDKENLSSPYHTRDSARRSSARRRGEMIQRIVRSRDSVFADPEEGTESGDSEESSPQRWTQSNPPSDLKKAAEFLEVARALQPLPLEADPRAALSSHPSQEALSVGKGGGGGSNRSRLGGEVILESRARRPVSIESASKLAQSQKGTNDSLGARFL